MNLAPILDAHLSLKLPHIPLGPDRRPLISGWGIEGPRWQGDRLKNHLTPWGDPWKSDLLTGIGLLLGRRSGIICFDFDVESPALINKLSLFDFKTIRRGNPKRFGAVYFKYSERFAKKQVIEFGGKNKLEILTNGQFVAIAPSWHDKHQVHYEDLGIPFLKSYKDLPEVPDELMEFLVSYD